jgi:hypothetical protein
MLHLNARLDAGTGSFAVNSTLRYSYRIRTVRVRR